MSNKPEVNIFWFRRDLRFFDNTGLFQALSSGKPVLPVFIFDRNILDKLEKPHDLRVQYIHNALNTMQNELIRIGSAIKFYHASPDEAFEDLLARYSVGTVFTNHDYEDYALTRDGIIRSMLDNNGTRFQTFKDQVVFEKLEVSKDDGSPYTVFTPYSRKWKAHLLSHPISFSASEDLLNNCFKHDEHAIPSLESMGFSKQAWNFPQTTVPDALVKGYTEFRNFPAVEGTSRFGVHLRFGTMSIRKLVEHAKGLNETFLNELIWRDFYHMILSNFPHVGQGMSFKKAYDSIEWRNNEADFDKWCKGETGYPIVDAGMRELLATGFMHNRVRMITASFLTKHLLIDWRWGEAWFAAKLLDYDLAANNGGWQWASGSGCDAAPYFRIFNPALQTEKFDKQAMYIRKWVPEFDTLQYAPPMVVHEVARKRCLETYAKYLGKD
jgi:deoxyribodipyrimidine photo-lyase